MSRCLLCKSSELTEFFLDDLRHYRCDVCDLIQLDSRHYLDPDSERNRYMEHDNTPDNQGYVKFLTRFLEQAVDPFALEGVHALDYGCGPGPVLQALLQERGYNTDIYDPFFFPQVPSQTYGLVTCTEVLEHLFTPREVLDRLVSLTDEGGVLSLMTRFHPGPEGMDRWWYRKDPTHVTFYSPKTFRWIEENYPLEMLMINDRDIVVYRRRC